MKIGTPGAGNVGSALATARVRAGHAVTLAATSEDDAAEIAAETGAMAASSNAEAVPNTAIVMLAAPFDAVSSIAQEPGAGLDGKVIVDVTNRVSPNQLDGTPNAEVVQAMMPNAPVVKAFNAMLAANQAEPIVDGVQLDGLVVGDDDAAKSRVPVLVASMGSHPVDTGSLIMSQALEAMAMLNISLNMTNNWSWQTGGKVLGPTG